MNIWTKTVVFTESCRYECDDPDNQIDYNKIFGIRKFGLDQFKNGAYLVWAYAPVVNKPDTILYDKIRIGWYLHDSSGGFEGMPIAESISRGVPCASSNTSSMQEVAGSLVRYFSPNSVDECLDAIVSLLKPAELKKARSQTKKYKITTWDKTYQQVCKILEIRGN